ncbi:protein of unknown function [Moritella yayanosii]|uniref:Uncharacterized protein n=1 Tax=Moritella yayanosii TaxID=69539 RepID=A0A330LY69_9GAMM|nr:protein of unknown function [Moritella yayanosii]
MVGQFQPFILLTTGLQFRVEIKAKFFGSDLNLYVEIYSFTISDFLI